MWTVTLQLHMYQLSNLQWTVTCSNHDIRHDACPVLGMYITRSWLLYLAKHVASFIFATIKVGYQPKFVSKTVFIPAVVHYN
jgi:hypothetical protein